MKIKITKQAKDPWWLVFKIVLFLLFALSIWSIQALPPPQRAQQESK